MSYDVCSQKQVAELLNKTRSLSFGNDICWITTCDPLFDQWNVLYY